MFYKNDGEFKGEATVAIKSQDKDSSHEIRQVQKQIYREAKIIGINL